MVSTFKLKCEIRMANTEYKKITTIELGVVVKLSREIRNWSQEQLAEISMLSVRTIQRVENGISASFDTRRALAIALGIDDIDYFNNPIKMITPDDIEKEQSDFDKSFLKLNAEIIFNAPQFLEITANSTADYYSYNVEICEELEKICANLIDLMRDYRDISNLYTELQKVSLHKEIEGMLREIKLSGFSIAIAKRKTAINSKIGDGPLTVNLIYISLFKRGDEPNFFCVPKKISFNF